MKKNITVMLSSLCFISLLAGMLSGCGADKTAKLNSGIVSDSTTTTDEFDVVVTTASGTDNQATSSQQGTTQSATKDSKSTAKSSTGKTVKPAGDTVIVNPNEIKLPALNLKNKTIKYLTRSGSPDDDCLALLKKHYNATVEVQQVTAAQLNTTLISLINSDKSPDLVQQDYTPNFISKNLVQEIKSNMVNFDSALWKGVKSLHGPYKKNNKYYYVFPAAYKYHMVWYNKKMFTQAGLKTPLQLYKANKWDWNAFQDAAKKLTQDSNKDGTPEIYGYGWDEPEILLYTTGKHIISFNSNGTATNNMRSTELARFNSFNVKLHNEVKQYPDGARVDLAQGKLAMVVGHAWYGGGYAKQIANGTIEFAPLPKDPAADKYYTSVEVGGFYIPIGSKNVEGGAALLNCYRYETVEPTYLTKSYKKLAERCGNWTNDMIGTFAEQNSKLNGVFVNWYNFGVNGEDFGKIFSEPVSSGKSWSSIVEAVAPIIDNKIRVFYQ